MFLVSNLVINSHTVTIIHGRMYFSGKIRSNSRTIEKIQTSVGLTNIPIPNSALGSIASISMLPSCR